MNEKIKELKQQAIDYAWSFRNEGNSASLDDIFQEKFAELIVQNVLLELADVRLEHVFDPETDQVFGIAIDRIKTTFRS